MQQNHAMHRSGGGQRCLEIEVNSRHPVMAVVLADRCCVDRDASPRDTGTEDMARGSYPFLIFVGCVLLLCSVCVLIEGAAIASYQYATISGWPRPLYQMTTALLGIGVFVELTRLIRRLDTPGALASLLPLATLPTWMGLIGTIYGYRNTYSIFNIEPSFIPRYSELAYAYAHCLSFVLIGLAASFPAVITIAIGSYVRVCQRL